MVPWSPVIPVIGVGSDSAGDSHSAKTLAKHPDLQMVLITLKCGDSLGEHLAAGSVALQVLEGSVRVKVSREVVDLVVGSLLTLGPSVPHDVEALDDSAVLLTIAGNIE